MSFFGTIGRLLQGKPPFEVPEEARKPPLEANEVNEKPKGPKRIPEVVVEEIECHEHGSQMQCLADIQNNFDEPVELDKIHIFGTNHELDTTLRAGEERQFTVFYGNRPTSTYDNRIELYYKDQSGDYFCSTHYLEFEKQRDNTYMISRVRFTPPVKDV